jgi:hypothetical protein
MFFKKAFKIFSIISLVLFIITLIIVAVLYFEAKEMKEEFPNSNNTFLFDINGNIVAGFKVFNAKEPVYLENIDNMNLYYTHKDFEGLREDSYLVMIMKKDLFGEEGEIDIGEFTFTYEESYEMLESENPMHIFASKVVETEEHATVDMVVEQFTESFGNADKFRSLVFASIFSHHIAKTNAVGILDGIQKDYITVYPNKLIFRLVRIIPESMVNDVVSGMEMRNGE